MNESKILTREEIESFFFDITSGKNKYNIDELLIIVKDNFIYYSDEKKNDEIIKDIYQQISYIICEFIQSQDYKSALRLANLLEIYVQEGNIGIVDYLKFISTYIYLLNNANDFNRLIFIVNCFLADLLQNKMKNIKKIKENNHDKKNRQVNLYVFVLKLLVGIFTFAGGVSNSIGLYTNSGKFFYYKKYFTGLVFLNYYSIGNIEEIIHPYDNVTSPYRLKYVIGDRNVTKYEKFKRFVKGLANKFNCLLTGYGEKPERVILTIISVIILFSFIYYIFEITNTNNYLQNLYFSIFTFTSFGFYQPFETKIINPNDNLISMLIFSFEIILGIVLNGVFIVTLSRKIMR